MAILSVQRIVKTGLNPTFAAAAGGGDSFPFTGREYFEVINGGGSPITVTIPAQKSCNTYGVSNVAHDIVVSVTNAERRKIAIPPGDQYVDANGRVQVTYSAVTTVTVGAFAP